MRKIKELPDYIKDLPMTALFDSKTVVKIFGFPSINGLQSACWSGSFPKPDKMILCGNYEHWNKCYWKKSTIMREFETRRKLD